MTPLLLDYYNRELQYLREMGQEFSRRHPKVGGRLGLHGNDCSDPHVERLLEGVAFLAARVHLKIDAEFPTFVDGLVNLAAPHLSAPVPSAMIARFEPDEDQGSLAEGVKVPRGTSLRSRVDGSRTLCEFRTTRSIDLWPIAMLGAEYQSRISSRSSRIPGFGSAGCWLELSCRVTSGLLTSDVQLDHLPVQLTGDAGQAARLYELLLAGQTRILLRNDRNDGATLPVPASALVPTGFSDTESLFPEDLRVSRGHRLLTEYFLLPQKFLGFEIRGLQDALHVLETDRFSILLLCEQEDPYLERRITRRDFELFCTPAVNIFPKRADRCQVNPAKRDFHVLPDRSCPTDYEVWRIADITGFVGSQNDRLPFVPAHGVRPSGSLSGKFGLYSQERRTRVPSSPLQRRSENDDEDLGTEVFLTLSGPDGGPMTEDLRQIAVSTFCTNRRLAARLNTGAQFGVDVFLPVRCITAVAGPTAPRPPLVFGGRESGWKFLSHLSLNYLSLLDSEPGEHPAALGELLRLYSRPDDRAARREIDGLKAIRARSTVARLPLPGPLVFGRGLQIEIHCDEDCFAGERSFLFASVLEQFLAEYVTINSFTQAALHTKRGEVYQWPPRTGQHPTL
ncbi:MAG: type VI secretion system baseplate subunit TssF [Planctomycetaceae bacterium]|nr:type VI secretion system baseplate subunit TssF [Planctomycetaceae bacterium]